MALKDDVKGIFDFLMRHQIYLEGVKNWLSDDFLRYLKMFRDQLRELLIGTGAERLSDMSRRALNSVLNKVQSINTKTIGAWGSNYLSEFRKLVRIDTIVQKAGLAAKTAKDFTQTTVSSVWRKVSDAINPASGSTYKEGTEQVIKRAFDFVQTALKQSHAKAEDIRVALKTLFGDEAANFKGGTLGRIWKEARAHIATSIQHGTSLVGETLGSAVSDCFRWCSIIDDITGEICRELNGQIFRWIDGPTTPAHPHCRSRRIPWPCDERNAPLPDFDEWVQDQPDSFVRDVFGESLADVTKRTSGKIKAYFKTRRVAPLTSDEFELKTTAMIG